MTDEVYVEDLLDWFNDATSKKVDPLNRKAAKKVDKLEGLIVDFQEACENLSTVEPSAIDKDGISAKSAQRLSQKYIRELEKFVIPEEPYSYEKINDLKKDLGKLINNFMRLGRKLIPKLGQIYKKEIHELNYYFQNLGNEWKKLNKFLEKKFKYMISIDQVISRIERIQEVFQQITEIKKEELDITSKIDDLESEKESLENEYNKIKQRKELQNLSDYERDLSKLKQRLLGKLGSLRKSFTKFENILGNKYWLPEDLKTKFIKYYKSPYKAFISEEIGYPKLKGILKELQKALKEKDLNLSSSKSDRALSKLDKILSDSLIPIQKKIKELRSSIEEINSDPEIKKAFKKLKKLEEKINEIQVKIDKEKLNLEQINENYDRNISKIIKYRSELIELIKKTAKKDIDIIFEQE
ncbi:MAG: hypothetical protein GF329_12575 [Candidatus Lokiarchaeota archaeon]|nr:hypothetical protein [Candidatus Lokiarchaeota archaeon]